MNPYKPSFSDRFWKFASYPFLDRHEKQQAFEYAALTNQLWRAWHLLSEKTVDVDNRDHFAMRWAANGGHDEMIRMLVSFGGDVNAKDGEPLIRAVTQGRDKAIDALLENGADLSRQNYKALRMAFDGHDTDTLKKMLATGQLPATLLLELHEKAEKRGQGDIAALFNRFEQKPPAKNTPPSPF